MREELKEKIDFCGLELDNEIMSLESKKKYPLLFSDNQDDQDREQIRERYERAWEEAKKAACLLKEKYGAKKVIVFGSLVDLSRFNRWSDIDLAVSGIPAARFYAAVGAVTRLITDFKVDLVDIYDCKESISKAIIREGVEI